MKFLRTALLLAVISFGLAWLFYYLMDDVIVSTWSAKMGEIGTVALVIFIFMLIAYVIAKSVVKGVTSISKKKPSDTEGPVR